MAPFKQYAKGLKKYLRKGLKDPSLALRYLRYGDRKAAQFQVRRVAETLGYKAEDVDRYYKTPELADFYARVSKAASPFTGVGAAGEDFYVMLRMLKPDIVVETGVFSGVSSSFILKALGDNNTGMLYSVDHPLSEEDLIGNS